MPKNNKKLVIIVGALLGLFVVGIVVSAYINKSAKNDVVSSKKKDTYVDPKHRQYGGTDTKRGENIKQPDNWPSDVAVYSGNIIFSNVARDGKAFTLGITTGDEVSAIKKYFAESLESDGWIKEAHSNKSGKVKLAYRKDGTRRAVTVIITKGSMGKSRNSISISVKE